MAQSTREHFAQGTLQAGAATSVFINCPFDQDFAPLFEAIVFATVCCGFLPRSALESGSVAMPRMERITHAIFSSKYSIHDLSRCTGQGEARLARFNMPLELGIAMARRYTQRSPKKQHDWLVLVPEGHQYLSFISDLAAFDPYRHDGTVEVMVQKVMSWLVTRPDAVRMLTPQDVLEVLPFFIEEKTKLTQQWGDSIPWAELVLAAQRTAPTQRAALAGR